MIKIIEYTIDSANFFCIIEPVSLYVAKKHEVHEKCTCKKRINTALPETIEVYAIFPAVYFSVFRLYFYSVRLSHNVNYENYCKNCFT